jgi:hypothetical protein
MKKLNKHYLSVSIIVIFVIIAFACTTVKQPVQTQERSYSNKNVPVEQKKK